jgi:hypothetical protein
MGDDSLVITLLFVYGLLGVNDTTSASTVEGYKPREFRLSVGWMF